MAKFTVRTLTESQWKEKWRDDVVLKEATVDLHDRTYAGALMVGAFRARFFVIEFPRLQVVWGGEAETKHSWARDDNLWKPALEALVLRWKEDRNSLPRRSGLIVAKG